jgi:hypothetical protein
MISLLLWILSKWDEVRVFLNPNPNLNLSSWSGRLGLGLRLRVNEDAERS